MPGADDSAYAKSKTLAERAAWDFIARRAAGSSLPWSIRSPSLGPALGPDYSTSIQMVKRCWTAGARQSEAVFRRRRRPGRCRPALCSAMTQAAARGRTLPGGGRRLHVDAGDRQSVEKSQASAGARIRTRQLPNRVLRAGAGSTAPP